MYKITFPSGSTVHYTNKGVLTGILDYANMHKQSTKKETPMNTHTITLESFIKDNTPEGMEYDKENIT